MTSDSTFFRIRGSEDDLGCHLVNLEDFCESHGLGIRIRYALTLVVDEVVTNIFKYGFERPEEGEVEVTLSLDGDRVTIVIVDNARPFDPMQAPEPEIDRPLEERSKPVGGMGIHLMRSLMDSCFYERREARNVLTLVKDVTASPGEQPGKE